MMLMTASWHPFLGGRASFSALADVPGQSTESLHTGVTDDLEAKLQITEAPEQAEPQTSEVPEAVASSQAAKTSEVTEAVASSQAKTTEVPEAVDMKPAKTSEVLEAVAAKLAVKVRDALDSNAAAIAEAPEASASNKASTGALSVKKQIIIDVERPNNKEAEKQLLLKRARMDALR